MPQLRNSVQCYIIFALDISVALDVDHFVLYRRAEVDFGVNGTVLDWLRSFVTNRSYSTLQLLILSALSYAIIQRSTRFIL